MEVKIGKVIHYYTRIGVAVLQLKENLKLGDRIHILGHTSNFTQRVTSLEVEHQPLVWVKPGDSVAIKVYEPARKHDAVYRILDEAPELYVA
ncbi:MAG: hypothetical protein IPP66_19205 [Anaerolineales bacterium]|nr:hypothetical protein [Anaerolineales bacterium]